MLSPATIAYIVLGCVIGVILVIIVVLFKRYKSLRHAVLPLAFRGSREARFFFSPKRSNEATQNRQEGLHQAIVFSSFSFFWPRFDRPYRPFPFLIEIHNESVHKRGKERASLQACSHTITIAASRHVADPALAFQNWSDRKQDGHTCTPTAQRFAC